MNSSARTVDYGTRSIDYLLERRDRSTLEITVEPDGRVRVIAPRGAGIPEVDARVRRRARWILSQQQYFAQFTPRTPARRYVPGETHLYLGRQYRLRVTPDASTPVKLVRGFILVGGVEFDDVTAIERTVTAWLRERAKVQFERRLPLNSARFSQPSAFTPTSLRLRRMTTRWGSLSPRRTLTLNPDLVRAPADAIDYVITHELCHLAVPHHGREFYDLQDLVLPDWRDRKTRLERIMA